MCLFCFYSEMMILECRHLPPLHLHHLHHRHPPLPLSSSSPKRRRNTKDLNLIRLFIVVIVVLFWRVGSPARSGNTTSVFLFFFSWFKGLKDVFWIYFTSLLKNLRFKNVELIYFSAVCEKKPWKHSIIFILRWSGRRVAEGFVKVSVCFKVFFLVL